MGNNSSREIQALPAPSHKSTSDIKDSENWFRLALGLELCIKPALLEILHDKTIGGLPREEDELYAELNELKQENSIPNISCYQWKKLCHECNGACSNPCPKVKKTDSKDFDITLIVALIRNHRILEAPTEGWNNLNPADNSKAANVARARDMRNTINHARFSTFSEVCVFDEKRREARAILSGLGVTDFEDFDRLQTACLDHQTINKSKVLEEKMNHILEVELPNKEELVNEMTDLVGRIECLEENSVTKAHLNEKLNRILISIAAISSTGKPSLSFKLKLNRKWKPFSDDDIDVTGKMHDVIRDQLESYFRKACGESAGELEIMINEIFHVKKKEVNQQITSSLCFKCEVVHQTNPAYIQNNLRNSSKSTNKARDIITSIKTDLVSTIKDELQIDTEIYVPKWKVGSLFVNLTIVRIDGKTWEDDTIFAVSLIVKEIMKEKLDNANVAVHHQNMKSTINMHEVLVDVTVHMEENDYNELSCLLGELDGSQYMPTNTQPWKSGCKFESLVPIHCNKNEMSEEKQKSGLLPHSAKQLLI